MKRQSGLAERRGALMRIIPLVVLASASSLALADPASECGGRCAVSTPEEARSLADVLYRQGDFQRAGECYQTAGESERANLAFTKAVGPASAVTAQRATDQADKARAMAQRYKKALHLQD